MKGTLRESPPSFSGRLKFAAAQANLRQTDIANACDVTRAAVSGWFKGSREPSSGNLLKLADVLAVRREWLMLYDNGPAARRGLALEVTRQVTNDAGRRAPPLPMSPAQFATDGALMTIYDKLLKLAQDWLTLPERDREKWSRTMERAASKHRAKPDDKSLSDVDSSHIKKYAAARTTTKRRNAKKRNGRS